jgi:hypothetical protein
MRAQFVLWPMFHYCFASHSTAVECPVLPTGSSSQSEGPCCTLSSLLSPCLIDYVFLKLAFVSVLRLIQRMFDTRVCCANFEFHVNPLKLVRFQVLTAASMMFRIVFLDVLPCKMIVDRRFRGAYCLQHLYAPMKRRSTIILHGSTSQKTILNLWSSFKYLKNFVAAAKKRNTVLLVTKINCLMLLHWESYKSYKYKMQS